MKTLSEIIRNNMNTHSKYIDHRAKTGNKWKKRGNLYRSISHLFSPLIILDTLQLPHLLNAHPYLPHPSPLTHSPFTTQSIYHYAAARVRAYRCTRSLRK